MRDPTFFVLSGDRLVRTRNKGWWSPTLTVKDPEIPWLPLETPTAAYYGILKRWTGAAWVKEPLATYLAGSWQSKPLKVWTGAAWETIDTTGV